MFLFILALVAITSTALAVNLIVKSKRPTQKLLSFKTRYKSEVWTPEQMEFALQAFVVSWLKFNPAKESEIKTKLNKLDIYWMPYKWTQNLDKVVGEIEDSNTIRLWHGPLLPGDRYRMSFTVLPELLVQYIVYHQTGEVVDVKTISKNYRQVVVDYRTKLQTQIGKPNANNSRLDSR